jgi:hypothetical protein
LKGIPVRPTINGHDGEVMPKVLEKRVPKPTTNTRLSSVQQG